MNFVTLRRAALTVALLATPGLHAAEVAGVRIEDSVRVGSSDLALNGAGLRSKLFIKLYVGALYVPHRSSQPAQLIDSNAPRRMSLRLLRDIGADTLHGALEEGLANNSTPEELAAIRPAADQFGALMKGFGKLREGDTVAIDFSGDGVSVSLAGEIKGKVAGAAFAKALLKVWLGDKPADASLKKALLGQ